jgi:uncharacterized protein YodC (DUF2158 family)
MSAPVVKLHPTFKVGETILCKSTGEELTILSITPEGNLQCEGRAGLMPAAAAEKKL